jgi:hypothetical protein
VSEGFESFGIEAHRESRFRERNRRSAKRVDTDIAIVRRLRKKPRKHPTEQCSARIAGEFAAAQAAGSPLLAVVSGLDEPVRIGNPALVKGEFVQHGKTVEPMVHGLLAEIELGPVRRSAPDSHVGIAPVTGSSRSAKLFENIAVIVMSSSSEPTPLPISISCPPSAPLSMLPAADQSRGFRPNLLTASNHPGHFSRTN